MFPILPKYPVDFCTSEGKFLDLHSPNDQEKISSVQYATLQDIDQLFHLIPNSFERMRALKAYERANILRKAAEKLKENTEKLALLISLEGGKPLKDAFIEVARAALTLETCAEETLRISGETIPMERNQTGLNHLAFTRREAIGPVLAISAFNHPINLIAHQVGGAIASGCSVVLKPAPSTPLCAYFFREILVQSGLPEGILFVINTDIPGIEKLVSSPLFRFVSFIGASKVGWHLRRMIADGVRISLEHGGVAPGIIRQDADLAEAAKLLCKSSFYHAGQVCISTQRIFVHHNAYEEFKSLFLKEAIQLKTGDARDLETDIGPLIRKAEISRVKNWIRDSIDLGAQVALEGKITGDKNQFLGPTILTDVPRQALIMNEEIFGPVVCLNPYADEGELIKYLNSSPYIFESSLFTKDISSALRISDKLESMTTVINNHNAFRVDWMPFGGHYQSGLGMGGVKYAIEEMTRLKQVIIKY